MSLQNAQQSSLSLTDGRASDFDAGTSFVRHYDDYDEMAADAPKWNNEYIKIGRESAGGSFRVSQTVRLQASLMEYHVALLAQGTCPPNCITLIVPTHGSALFHRGRELTPNEIAVFHPGHEFACHVHGPLSAVGVALNESYLSRQANLLAHEDVFTAFRAPSFRLDHGSYQKFAEIVNRVVHLTLFRPELLASTIAAKRFEDEIASQLVSSVTSPTGDENRGVRHRAARRALDYIRANADELLAISDLCREIGASQRTLEIGFQELYGMPPKVYLTMLRLKRARRDLLQADRARDSVTDVATRWGFFHFGRFAKAYHQQYGELPNATIKRVS